MKIFEIATGYTPIPARIPAATEKVVEELTRAFLALGQEAEILDIASHSREASGLPLREVWVPPFLRKEDVRLGLFHRLKRIGYSCFLAGTLRRILSREEAPVWLHFHNQYNLFFFLLLVPRRLRPRARIAYTNHNGLWSLPWEEGESTLRRRYFQEMAAMKQADRVFVLNEATRENVVTHLNLPETRVFLIPNGGDTAIYRPLSQKEREKIREALGLRSRQVILQVGSVNENKGQLRSLSLLAPQMQKNPHLVFACAGAIVSEDYREKLAKLAEQWGLKDRVRYLGTFPPGEGLNRIYNAADGTILYSNYEGFPLVCMESLAAGVPVLLAGRWREDLGPGCIQTDAENLEAVLNTLPQLGKCARETALEHTWQAAAKQYLTVMEERIP